MQCNEINEHSRIYNSNTNSVKLESKVELQPRFSVYTTTHSFVPNSMSAIISRDKRHVA